MIIFTAVSGLIAIVACFLSAILRGQVKSTIPGSNQRYCLTSLLIVSLGIESIGWTLQAVGNLYLNREFFATLGVLLAVWTCRILISYIKDDNWFNDTGKRLKKRMKKLASIRVRMPRLAISPSV